MALSEGYRRQVELLLRLMPAVAAEESLGSGYTSGITEDPMSAAIHEYRDQIPEELAVSIVPIHPKAGETAWTI